MKRFSALLIGLLLFFLPVAVAETQNQQSQDRVENWRGKTVMVFTPHPDDDLFGCGGTLALLARNGNKIIIVIYTNDNKGSFDLEMTSERLARIRKAEEEASCEVLGIPKENIIWLGYNDGELEYAEPKALCGQATKLIRQHRPDVLFSIDPGELYERWHKSDHRMAAFNTIDAVRAAEFHLYYPDHLLTDNLKPYRVPLLMFYYAASEANYHVDITEVFDLKVKAASKQVSQFEPSISKYRPDWDPKDLEKLVAGFRARAPKKDGRYVESFRRATGFNQQ
ncbi:MAG TPA: PIG-L deacetylase family protein [Blastocatellia bacterium]|nr:PIG-L deacetylase family protein [Blastocatellia bacterium]